MCGGGAVTDRTCPKWFARFHAGDILLDNDPQSGRPVEVDSNQIETLIGNNQHYTMAGDSQHPQNIQINTVIGEMKNMSFILQKKLSGPFGQPSIK